MSRRRRRDYDDDNDVPRKLLRMILLATFGLVLLPVMVAVAQDDGADEYRPFITKYGKPDIVNDYIRRNAASSAKIIQYTAENVGVTFFPIAPPRSQGPFSKWKLIGYSTPRPEPEYKTAELPTAEVERRLAKRASK